MARRVTQAQAYTLEIEQQALTFFKQCLSAMPDPRRNQGKRFSLQAVVVIALMAMICGADDAQAMESFGDANAEWLKEFLDLPHGAPSQDVYLAVFAALDPKHFNEVLRSWAELLAIRLPKSEEQDRHIAIDGKTSRRSFSPANDLLGIHTVSAWMSDAGLVMGQIKTAEKSNEITAIPELIKLLDITGATITIDAMGCQTKIASTIIEGGGDYLLAVKTSQPTLHADIKATFENSADGKTVPAGGSLSEEIESWEEINKGHGRIERRTIELARDLSRLKTANKWSNLNFIAQITREREILLTGKTSSQTAYYIGSNPEYRAKQAAKTVRGHWSIENNLHWVLDIAFREDEARHRAGNTASNMSTMRHFAMNVIKQDENRKIGVANSRKRAGWDRRYLVELLVKSRSN